MRLTRFLTLTIAISISSLIRTNAQDKTLELIKDYGTFDRWCVREIKESGIIGGHTKYLYEFYGNPSDTLRTGKV